MRDFVVRSSTHPNTHSSEGNRRGPAYIFFACVVAVCRAKLPPVILWIKTEIIIIIERGKEERKKRSAAIPFDGSMPHKHCMQSQQMKSVHNLLTWKWCWHIYSVSSVSAFAMVVSHRHASHRIAGEQRVGRAIQTTHCGRAPCSVENNILNMKLFRQSAATEETSPSAFYSKPFENMKGWTFARILLVACVNVLTAYDFYFIFAFKCILKSFGNWMRVDFESNVCAWMKSECDSWKTRNFGCNAETRRNAFRAIAGIYPSR